MTSICLLLLAVVGDEPARRIITGSIKSIDGESMTLKNASGLKTFRILPEMHMTRDGESARIHEAKTGDTATVTYDSATGKPLRISVTSAEAVKRKGEPQSDEAKAQAAEKKRQRDEKAREEAEDLAERRTKAAEKKAEKKKLEDEQRRKAREEMFQPPPEDPTRHSIGPFETNLGKMEVTLTRSAPWEITFTFTNPARRTIKSQQDLKLKLGRLPEIRATSLRGDGPSRTGPSAGPQPAPSAPRGLPPSLTKKGRPGSNLDPNKSKAPLRDEFRPPPSRSENKDRGGAEVGQSGQPFSVMFVLPGLPQLADHDHVTLQIGDGEFRFNKIFTPNTFAQLQDLFREASRRRDERPPEGR